MNENYIYIGPTAAKLGLVKSTLVLGAIPPPQLLSLINLKPMIRALFVSTEKCAVARQNMDRQGTIEWLATQEIIRLNTELRTRKDK
jgi:hypothetical protein